MGLLTQAQLIAEAPDGGLYTAAEYRNMLNDVIRGLVLAPYSLDDAEDIWWQGDAAGMTEVTVTGTQTITEKDGQLSVVFQGQSTSDVNCLLKARTFAAGDSFATRIRTGGAASNFTIPAFLLTDGTSDSSNCVMATAYVSDANPVLGIFTGTLTNAASVVVISPNSQLAWLDGLYIKIKYVSSNTFQVWWSCDGISWADITVGTFAKTMTPTHIGVGWSRWGSSVSGVANFGPICKLS